MRQPSGQSTGQSRTVRIFISSTFRDFAQERDLLVRKVFPELRRRCRERQVELVDVDLRWGITEAEAEQGKVLPICLAEIDRARPFFMGLLGERYGWVPAAGQFDRSLLIEQPWLEEHAGGRSVTELEILHGVLNNPQMAGRAFFYFRDPAWSAAQGPEYASANEAEQEKLAALKNRIRTSGFRVVEDYSSPETLADRVREDLWTLIDAAYPEADVPDPLALERRRHEAYGGSRRRLYLGGERYFEALDEELAAESPRPVLVRGRSGGGKSALLANWLARWSQAHPDTAVIVHHLGCGADAADPVRLSVRLMQEIARLVGEEFKTKSDPDEQLDDLAKWLATASAWAERTGRAVLLVLDGLDKLADRRHLRWFPTLLPAGVRLVASCLDGEVLEAASPKLPWRELVVEPFTAAEQTQFIGEYLGRFRKQLTAEQARLLQAHPLVGNPLFLLTVLEELRVFGVHEELDKRLATLLSPPPSKQPGEEPTVDDAFEHLLARMEADYGAEPVQRVMEAIWASRAGLYTDEILAIAELPPATWAGIANALDESLYESSGRINFGHDYLRKAVEDRYGIAGDTRLPLHRRLAEYFASREVVARVAEELPWQRRESQSREKLRECLLNLEMFSLLYTRDEYELLGYWVWLGDDASDAYMQVFRHFPGPEVIIVPDDPASQPYFTPIAVTHVAWKLANFLQNAGYRGTFVLDLYQRVLVDDRMRATVHTATLCNRIVSLRSDDEENAFARALELSAQVAIHQCITDGSFLDPVSLTGLRSYANVLGAAGDYTRAEQWFRTAIDCFENVLGPDHPNTLLCVHDFATLRHRQGRLVAAGPLFLQALEGREKALGPHHPDTLASAHMLATVLSIQGDYAAAELFYRRALEGRAKALGPQHPDTRASRDRLSECVRAVARIPPGTVMNSIGMKLVPIPAGEFLMGSPEDCPFGDATEEFQHRVRITKPFLLGMHQVTQEQYERVTGQNPSLFKGPDLPVEHLAWNEARRFCELLSDLPEERAAGRRYRLPTEAEWEYACRAGTTTTFNTGDSLKLHEARFGTKRRSSPKPTAPVGSYPPNAWGLFDMHGNVWEWTSDWFSADYFRESPVDDPQGPPTGTHHALRGGSASVEANECRSSIRGEAGAVDGPETETGNRYPSYGDFGVRVVAETAR